MSASTYFANALLTSLLIDGDFGSVVVALHTADPGAAGNQSTSTPGYTGYAPVTVGVGAGEWDVTGNAFENVEPIEFPEATAVAGTVTITHFTIGDGTNIYLRGLLNNPLTVNVGTEPRFKAGTLIGSVNTSAPAP